MFEKNDWELLGPRWIRDRLATLENVLYQNDAVTMVMKLRGRGADGPESEGYLGLRG